ncbi:MAG TPA: hypothetical protein VGY98_07350 [Verrucomicrobiae bacterium]|nr:hypothetical protein [Verrucomicrobiae bacterium]
MIEEQHSPRWLQRGFYVSCAAILVVTACAKIWSAHLSTPILFRRDSLLYIDTQHVLVFAAIYELLVSFFLVFSHRNCVKSILIAITGSEFLLYRFFKAAMHDPRPCPCLGNVPASIGLTDNSVNWILIAIASYFVCGGITFYAMRFNRSM